MRPILYKSLTESTLSGIILLMFLIVVMIVANILTVGLAGAMIVSTKTFVFYGTAWASGWTTSLVISVISKLIMVDKVVRRTPIEFGEAATMLYHFHYKLDKNPENWNMTAINRDYEDYKRQGLL